MIEIRPHKGRCRGRTIDLNVDCVWLVDAAHPKPGELLGFADRRPGAPLLLIVNSAPPAVIKEATRALDDRDFGDLSDDKRAMARGTVRDVVAPPMITADDEDTPDPDLED
jgi:hypothetical protein